MLLIIDVILCMALVMFTLSKVFQAAKLLYGTLPGRKFDGHFRAVWIGVIYGAYTNEKVPSVYVSMSINILVASIAYWIGLPYFSLTILIISVITMSVKLIFNAVYSHEYIVKEFRKITGQ